MHKLITCIVLRFFPYSHFFLRHSCLIFIYSFFLISSSLFLIFLCLRSQHNPTSIRVTLGDYILHSDLESLPHEVFTVTDVRLHPNFRFTPQADRFDVAVLILDRTAHYQDNIKPICLPQKDADFLGKTSFVAGWGALQAGQQSPSFSLPPALLSPYYSLLSLSLSLICLSVSLPHCFSILRSLYFLPGTGILTHFLTFLCFPFVFNDHNFNHVFFILSFHSLQSNLFEKYNLLKGSKLRPKVLQHVAVPVVQNSVCEGWHRKRGINIRIHDEMMCAGYEFGGRDACQVSFSINHFW